MQGVIAAYALHVPTHGEKENETPSRRSSSCKQALA